MKNFFKNVPSILILFVFITLTYNFFDFGDLWESSKVLWKKPSIIFLILLVYLLSFVLKAFAWKIYLKGRPSFLSCLAGLFYSLFLNHILPVKVGDLARAGVLPARDQHITAEESLHSVFVLRVLDMLCLSGIALIGIFAFHIHYRIPFWALFFMLVISFIALPLLKKQFPIFINRHVAILKSALSGMNGIQVFLLTLASWILEAAVLYGTIFTLNKEISLPGAVWANSVTIAGQVFQITPGGIANYEAFMSFALGFIGFSFKEGYTIAILTHGLKFIFSYLAGFAAICIFPVPINVLKSWIRQKGVKGK
ncbi:lysylphosphatidylglycerol synthetase family protein [Bacillus methanolicus]|uniref:lysylphosphatidylglycerol synthase transmembrane domain-containing protein n=1 Tax=Bacillus methanolicus TaxID=1471 RepID=UPI002380C062|nr:lysylphosphatidylglycerol synthase transmembrane domain-containing protein [Bacillus methanolicus]MDE3839836.1 lysylphosphatidylglycerol synthetase family protein [Bacillus methanolicus]